MIQNKNFFIVIKIRIQNKIVSTSHGHLWEYIANPTVWKTMYTAIVSVELYGNMSEKISKVFKNKIIVDWSGLKVFIGKEDLSSALKKW